METTIQATNNAINIDINVSINVGALKENIQRGWQAMVKASKQFYRKACMMVRTIDVRNVLSNLWIGGWTIALFYLIYMYA